MLVGRHACCTHVNVAVMIVLNSTLVGRQADVYGTNLQVSSQRCSAGLCSGLVVCTGSVLVAVLY